MLLTNLCLLPVQRIDKLLRRAEKWGKFLTIYGNLWWLLFLCPLHNFSCSLLSGYCMFLLVLLRGVPLIVAYCMFSTSFSYTYEQRNLTFPSRLDHWIFQDGCLGWHIWWLRYRGILKPLPWGHCKSLCLGASQNLLFRCLVKPLAWALCKTPYQSPFLGDFTELFTLVIDKAAYLGPYVIPCFGFCKAPYLQASQSPLLCFHEAPSFRALLNPLFGSFAKPLNWGFHKTPCMGASWSPLLLPRGHSGVIYVGMWWNSLLRDFMKPLHWGLCKVFQGIHETPCLGDSWSPLQWGIAKPLLGKFCEVPCLSASWSPCLSASQSPLLGCFVKPLTWVFCEAPCLGALWNPFLGPLVAQKTDVCQQFPHWYWWNGGQFTKKNVFFL